MSTPNRRAERASTCVTPNDRCPAGARGDEGLRLDRVTVRILRVSTGIRTGVAQPPLSFTYTTI